MLNPKIDDWFKFKGWVPHNYQIELNNKLSNLNSALVIAPTGGGKTLAGFIPAIADIIKEVPKGLHTLYISPLKALANDIERNLEFPIKEMELDITLETRTGDTKQSKRNWI